MYIIAAITGVTATVTPIIDAITGVTVTDTPIIAAITDKSAVKTTVIPVLTGLKLNDEYFIAALSNVERRMLGSIER